MKILIGVDRLSKVSGISRVAGEMAEHLYDRGYDVKLVCGKCEVETKVPIILCQYHDRLYQSDILDVRRIIKKEKPDIFHSHYYPMDFCGALLNSSRTKHVTHAHGVNHQSWWLNWRNPLALLRADIGAFLGSHFSTKVIAISNYMKNELKTKYRVAADKIEVVYNSVDLAKFNPSINGDEIREKYHIQSDEVLLLCVAALTPRKRHDLLIDCIKLLIEEDKRIKLLIVGGGGKTAAKYEKALTSKVHDAALDKQVIFCGLVGNELAKYYAACDIYVSASSWESFGLPFIEPMACGKPIIGFDISAVSELITNGRNGYKIKYPDINQMASKIMRLVDNPEKRKLFGINGRRIAEQRFNAETNIEKIIKLYSRLS